MRRLLLTGAAGRIGTAYRKHATGRYLFRLTDIRPLIDAGEEEFIEANLADPDAARALCEGIDTVVHMAADPRTTAEFYADLLDSNFKATYNIYRAAKDAGCKRLIFASSVNAIFGYPAERQIRIDDAPCPGNVYGVSKAFGESLGAYFGNVEGLRNLSIRIGAVGELDRLDANTPDHVRTFFVTYRDLCHLLDRCIEADLGDTKFSVVHGVSNNRHSLLDLTETRRLLDYNPIDDAFTCASASSAVTEAIP